MNKILSLFDEQFVRRLLDKEVLPLYSDFKEIISLKIETYKKLIWITTYHVVISYRVVFLKDNGEEQKLEIVCSAHSHEPRENVFKVLNFLWSNDVNGEEVALPNPLFYNEEFNGTFYRAIEGENLLKFIKNGDREKIEIMLVRTAVLFARLHSVSLPKNGDDIFSDANMSLRTVVPGKDNIIWEIGQRFQGKYVDDIMFLYDRFIKQEDDFFAQSDQRWLIHGDAHPENIIAVGENKVGVIDFTDFCPADFARDLGAFLQQLEYKIKRNLKDLEFAVQMKQLFLNSYLEATGLKLDESLQSRMDLYYNWTAIRTATFYLLKHECDQEKAAVIINEVKNNLNINYHVQN